MSFANLRTLPVLLAILLAAPACASSRGDGRGTAEQPASTRDQGKDAMQPSRNDPDPAIPARRLTLVADLQYSLSIGYGHVWKATVREVRTGELADDIVQLRLMQHDYGGKLPCCDARTGVLLELVAVDERPGALEGFVASDGTIWKLTALRAAE